MNEYQQLIDRFVQQNQSILGGTLVGVYLHGSAVMGCFNSQKSDLDLMIVVNNDISNETKRAYMDIVLELNQQAPLLRHKPQQLCHVQLQPIHFFSVTPKNRPKSAASIFVL